MSKYDPLRRYLEARQTEQIPMTFAEVERVLGFSLPPSARTHPTWWSNNTGTHVGVRAWRDAGWKTSRVDMPGEKIVFVRHRDEHVLSVRETGPSYVHSEAEGGDTVRISALSPMADALVRRRMGERAVSAEQAIADLLHEAAVERRRRLLDQFPLVGEPSSIDSVDLIREDRDAR